MNAQIVRVLLQAASKSAPQRGLSSAAVPAGYKSKGKEPYFTLTPEQRDIIHPRIGNREIVGFGLDGDSIYYDHKGFPFPAIRFQEPSASNSEVREKEKGDWKALTLAEKKALYRYSFCQTFTEIDQMSGQWKQTLGMTFAWLGMCCWLIYWVKYYVLPPGRFGTDPELKLMMQRKMIDEYYQPIFGTSANWDYEKLCWREGVFRKDYKPSV